MIAFDSLFPDVATETVRVLHLASDRAIAWREFHCPDPHCDCRRVQLHATDLRTGEVHLVVSHGFSPFRARPEWEDEQTYVEPLSETGPLARALWDAFPAVMTPDYEERLKRHHEMMREAVRNDSRIDPRLEGIDLLDRLEKLYRLRRPRSDFDDVGRNDPCPCGSGKKYKKCCLRR